MDKTLRIDCINIGLILVSCVLAHYLPFGMVLFSYAFIGPAHYLTQISWMHDRNYFVKFKYAGASFVILAILCLMMPSIQSASTMVAIILAISLFYVMPEGRKGQIMGAALGGLIVLSSFYSPVTTLFFAILLPTVMHIFVFTACFMWAGAIKTKRASSYIALGVLLTCAASFFAPTPFVMRPNIEGLQFFDLIVDYMKIILPLSESATVQVFGFLSFAYTYHYLNWFSKAEVIHWHRIPRNLFHSNRSLYV
jgi:hypothetical protein